jgi:glycosyltransferase involved in cell wall biosynthesis
MSTSDECIDIDPLYTAANYSRPHIKIAIVYDAVYPYSLGGGERRYYELAIRLAQSGHEVHWFGMHWWNGPRVMHKDGVTYHGICPKLPLYTRSGRRSVIQALVFGLAAMRLIGYRFDVVDCCGFPFFSIFSARLAIAVRGGHLVSTWHEVWGREYWVAYLRWLGIIGHVVELAAARIPNLIIAVSESTASRLAVIRHGDVIVMPNGVDSDAIGAIAPNESSCDIIYAGRLCDFKDVELLLSAVALLACTRPSLTCRIVGKGPHLAALEIFASNAGIADRVRFDGPLPGNEFYAAIASARAFVLPSQREGFGMVVLEANAAGVPVVVAAHPGNWAVELVQNGNGLVVTPAAASVAEALDQLLDEPPGARADACREMARRFDWNAVAAGYQAQLLEVSNAMDAIIEVTTT